MELACGRTERAGTSRLPIDRTRDMAAFAQGLERALVATNDIAHPRDPIMMTRRRLLLSQKGGQLS